MQNKHVHKISFRVTNEEKQNIEEKVKISGFKKSAVIRQLVLEGIVNAKMTDTEREGLNSLKGIANNLNQLAKKANQGQDFLTLYTEIVKTKNLIDEFINHIYKR
jgi:hypothetical protein